MAITTGFAMAIATAITMGFAMAITMAFTVAYPILFREIMPGFLVSVDLIGYHEKNF